MEEKRSWWQYIRLHPVRTVLIAIFVVLSVLVFIGGYKFNWNWTGFNSPSRTLWDWLELLGVLAVPIVVGFGAVWFTTRQTQASEARNKQQRETELQIATDNQREVALQAYIDKISELLLKEHLGEQKAYGQLTPEGERVAMIARVRTITVLTQLDARRVSYVFAFLREVKLMSAIPNDNVVRLGGADLHAVDWSEANLPWAVLSEADLSGAFFSYANLRYADLRYANLSNTNFSGADLSWANLSNAVVTQEQLEEAMSLEGATMPDGSIHR